jgi:succinate-semialdehyde dehydrogenase / glutarate-semialdehyde dehydrogenase
MSDSEIELMLEQAHLLANTNQQKSIVQKSDLLRNLAVELRKSKSILARQMSLEMGKPLAEAEGEVEKSALCCQYFSENLENFLQDEVIGSTRIVKQGLGPLLAIMPWNFPVWQVIRVAAPAIGLGNPILLKHSEITAGSAKLLQNIFDGVEKGLLFNLRVNHEVTSKLIADHRVRAVTLTGSIRAGRAVAEVAGRHLKKSVMELGGSDAYLILEDADLSQAAAICAKARLINNGQSCISAKRFIIPEKHFAEFSSLFQKEVSAFKMGDPMDKNVNLGPLAHKKFQQYLVKQCQMLVADGAESIFNLDPGENFNWNAEHAFFPARAYEVTAKMKSAMTEEFFGPVALLFSYRNEKEALEIANATLFGLGGAIFSKDIEKASRLAQLFECGSVGINQGVFSDPKIPFGGTKESGFGRELGSYGFNEFANVKSILSKS